jgi:hypothetical protein
MSEPINIPPSEPVLTDEEKLIFGDPYNHAKFRLFHEGEFYPVGRMLDALGQVTTNPLHAFACVAFSGKWGMMQCHPGDIEPIREGRPWI